MVKNLYLNSLNPITVNDDSKGSIEGVISTETLNSYEFKVSLNAFDNSIQARRFKGVKGIKFLFDHNRSQVIGVVKNIFKENNNLKIECCLNLDIAAAREIYSNLKMGAGAGFSVGFRVKEEEIDKGIRNIVEGDLFEVSLTYFPANEDCTIEKVLHMNNEINVLTSIKEEVEQLRRDIIDPNGTVFSPFFPRQLSESLAKIDRRVKAVEINIEALRDRLDILEARQEDSDSTTDVPQEELSIRRKVVSSDNLAKQTKSSAIIDAFMKE